MWKSNKYISAKEKETLIGIIQKNKRHGRVTTIRFKKKHYAYAKLQRHINEKKLPESFFNSLESRAEGSRTWTFGSDLLLTRITQDLREDFEVIVADQVVNDSTSGPEPSPHPSLSALSFPEPRRRDSHLSSPRQSLRDHEQLSAEEEWNTDAEGLTLASIWDGLLRKGVNSGEFSPEERADLHNRALRFYEKHCGDKSYDFNKITELTENLWSSNKFNDAEELDRINIELAEQSLGSSHLCTLELKGNLACVLSEQGNYGEAERLELSVVKAFEHRLGEDDERKLRSKTNLGYTYMNLGKWEEAELLFRDIAQRARNVSMDDIELSAKQNLGETLTYLHRYQEAKEVLSEVASKRGKLLGDTDERTLKAQIVLTSLYQAAGDFAESDYLLSWISCAITSEKYPPTLLWTLEFEDKQARQFFYQGQIAEAEHLLKNIVLTKEGLFSARHPTTVESKAMLANTYHYQLKSREATELGQCILTVCEDVFGKDNRSTLTVRSNLAWYQSDSLQLSKLRSEMEEVLKLRRAILGEDDPETLHSYMYLANVYSKTGNWRNWQPFFTKLQEMQRKKYGTEEHPEYIGGLQEYANVLKENGEYSKLQDIQREALELTKAYYGPKHLETLKLIRPLAITLIELGQFEEARRVLSDGVSTLESILGSQHPLTINLLSAQAFLYRSEQNWAEVETLDRQILDFWVKYFGSGHPFAIFAKTEAAWTFQQQHKFLEAGRLYSEALKDALNTFGPQHGEVANIFVKIARLQEVKGNWREASRLYDNALEMKQTILGSFDLIAARNVLDNFSGMFIPDGFSETQGLHFKARHLRERISSSDNRETLNIIANIARLRSEQRQWDEAERLYRELLNKRQIFLLEDENEDLEVVEDLALVYVQRGNFLASKELYEKVLARRIELLGDTHTSSLRSMSNLALYHSEQEDWVAAESLYREVLERQRKGLGDWHPNTIATMGNLASTLRCQCQFKESDKLLQDILSWKISKFGENHPQTAFTIESIAVLRSSQCYFTEAEEHFKRALQILESTGASCTDVIPVICDLANSYEFQGKDKEAEREREKAFRLGTEYLDSTHPGFVRAKKNLARSRNQLGRPQEAETILEELLELKEFHKDQYGSDILGLKAILGDALLDQGKFKECEELMEKTITVSQEGYWRERPEVMRAGDRLVLAKRRMGKLSEAEALQRSLLEKRVSRFGESSLEVETSLQSLMFIMAENGNFSDAVRFGQQALKIRRSLSVDSGASTFRLKLDIANLMSHDKKHSEAEEVLEQMLLEQCKSNSISLREQSDLLRDLGNTKIELKKFSEARLFLVVAISLEQRTGDSEIEFPDFSFLKHQCCQSGVSDTRRSVVTPRHITNRETSPGRLLKMFKLLIGTEVSSGNLEVAEYLLTEMLRAMELEGRTECQHYLWSMHTLIEILIKSGKCDEAEYLCHKAIHEAKRIYGEGHDLVLDGMRLLTRTTLLGGELVEGEALQEHLIQVSRQSRDSNAGQYVIDLVDMIWVKIRVMNWEECAQLVLEWAFATLMSPGDNLASPAGYFCQLAIEEMALVKGIVQREGILTSVFGYSSACASSAVEKALTVIDSSE